MQIAIILIYIGSVVWGVYLGSKKGEGCISFAMTILLGPFWLPVIILSKGDLVKCPHCAELVKKDARVCKHCGNPIPIKISKFIGG